MFASAALLHISYCFDKKNQNTLFEYEPTFIIMGLSLPGLPGYGGTARTPISARKTFSSRIVVLLSGMDLS